MSSPLRRSVSHIARTFSAPPPSPRPSPSHSTHQASPPLSPSTSSSKIHTPPPPQSPHTTFTLPLPSGRHLGYTIYGAPHGRPLFFFHGSPSSRLEGAEWHAAALATSTRIIAVDRWGHGLSSPRADATLLAWPADVRALAAHLRLGAFHVLGGSGGGPYALACARVLPRGVLLGTGVVGGVGPPAAGTRGMAPGRKFAVAVNRTLPASFMERLLNVAFGRAAQGADDAWAAHAEKLIATLTPEEKAYYAAHAVEKAALLQCYREAFRQGSSGPVRDAKLVLGPWGFELGDVEGEVRLWNGAADVNVPVHAARWMAGRLPRARLTVFEGATHFGVPVKHAEEILGGLMGMGR